MISSNINQYIEQTADNMQGKIFGDNKSTNTTLPKNSINDGQDLSYLVQRGQTLLSYASLILDRRAWQRSGTEGGDPFNLLDSPSNVYFKLLFYFWNGDDDDSGDTTLSGGLLAPTWEVENWDVTPYKYTSAWTYLKNNHEDERAELLKHFVSLLSNISCYSPWYFSELSNINEALSRKYVASDNFKIDEERKSITIKCLPDPFDSRISTLLELYRSIVWSQDMKREILPANLRKFDMGLYIYSDPVYNMHRSPRAEVITNKNGQNTIAYRDKYSSIGDTPQYKSSYKYIEFHNCEIDFNSSTSGYDVFSNTEGTQQTFNITIYFDDCREERYNEFIFKTMGDFIHWDVSVLSDEIKSYEKEYSQELNDRLNLFKNNSAVISGVQNTQTESKGLGNKIAAALKNAGKEVVGAGVSYLETQVKKLFLGNLYGLSVSNILDTGEMLAQGKVFSTARRVDNMVNKNKKNSTVIKLGNIYKSDSIIKNL